MRFQASQTLTHSALSERANHRSGGLEPALHHHTGKSEAALDFDTAPFLRGHVIRDEEPAPASPAHISIPAASYKSERGTPDSRIRRRLRI